MDGSALVALGTKATAARQLAEDAAKHHPASSSGQAAQQGGPGPSPFSFPSPPPVLEGGPPGLRSLDLFDCGLSLKHGKGLALLLRGIGPSLEQVRPRSGSGSRSY